jgi:hypothetical protein
MAAMAIATQLRLQPLLAHCYLGLGNLYQRQGEWARPETIANVACVSSGTPHEAVDPDARPRRLGREERRYATRDKRPVRSEEFARSRAIGLSSRAQRPSREHPGFAGEPPMRPRPSARLRGFACLTAAVWIAGLLTACAKGPASAQRMSGVTPKSTRSSRSGTRQTHPAATWP